MKFGQVRRKLGGKNWLRGIWQSQRQHAANGRRKLYAKTMTKHTRQTDRRMGNRKDRAREWGTKSEKRMPTICIQCKATDKVSFFPYMYMTFFLFLKFLFQNKSFLEKPLCKCNCSANTHMLCASRWCAYFVNANKNIVKVF